ncbi:ribonuclease H-like domain-containing protein [Tanacetum coccineum]|uniref:Ribonuclease H-like domain-containing protein n=1 Tax=Tanacetum coccineum TaxID=301880 RepID=A0ABQ4ZVB5_9ASTR
MASRDQQWYMDTRATSHLSSHTGNLHTSSLNRIFHSIIVENGSSISVTHSGHVQIPNPYRPLHLRNVLVTPNIIKNLVSVSKLTTDNKCSIDFDPYGFTVQDYHTRQTILRCDNTGDLYPLHVAASAFALLTNNHSLWHQCLGHPSDALKLLHFRAFVKTQFNREIKAFQCDHGGEFDNNSLHELFATNGIQFRFSCPRTSQQNGKSERMIRTINNVVRSLLFQARLPPEYWVEALLTTAYLLNIIPSTSINNDIPYIKLFNKPPSYTHLRTFGCLCYPYTFPPHKLAPRTTPSIFLGYPYNHRGYRCLDLNTNKIIISRHVTFDETVFPFGSMTPTKPPSYKFLDDNLDTSPIALRLLTTPTSPQQTPPQTTPQTNPQTTPQSTPPTPLSTPSPQTTPTPPTTPPPPPTSQHPMVTRSKVGIVKANPKYNLHVTTSSPIPKSPFHALRDPNWKQAMCDEYKALIDNNTWVLVPRPPNVNIVRSMWLYKHKYNADGSLNRYKARLVANGRSQQQGIDCDETFSPVVKPATIRTVLSLAVSRQWPIHQLDVKNAFLHDHLTKTVYMHQPPGFTNSAHSDYVCLLQKSLYGLKQAPELASSTSLLQRIISLLHAEFAMTDLGPLNYFLGISATRTTSGIFLSQTKYAIEILKQAQMLNCNPCRTPIDTEKKLGPEGSPVIDPTLYRILVGSLQYLTFTRPDLSYAIQQLCLYPREPHLNAMKRVLRYLQGTTDLELQLFRSTTSQLIAYSDADWVGCPATRRSTSRYCVFFYDNLLTWSSKRQDTLSCSSAEAEYREVANAVAETSWIRNLLRELYTPLFIATLVYCDNVSAVYMSANPVQHQRTKHIEIDIHFVRDKVAAGHVRVLHVLSRFQYADIFTKGLPYPLFANFRSSLSVRKTPAPTAGAY